MLRNESKVGRRGTVLQNDFPSLGLLGGDRLEPSRSLKDTREFDRVPVGTHVLFWRAKNEIWQSIVVPCLRLNHTSQS